MNKEERREYHRKYRAKNRERFRDYYRKRHPIIKKEIVNYPSNPIKRCVKCRKIVTKKINKTYICRDCFREYWQKRNAKRREMLNIRLGYSCSLCERTTQETKILFHEIHGKPHTRSVKYILEHHEEFIPLCYKCHGLIHKIAKVKNPQKAFELIKNLL